MHDTPSPKPDDVCVPGTDSPVSVPLPSAGPSGDLAVEAGPALWERVEAFRDLLHRGGLLLGEVLTFTRSAELAVGALEREKLQLDEQRRALDSERARLGAEVDRRAARLAGMNRELEDLRAGLERTRVEHGSERRALELSLEESRARSRVLEKEVSELRLRQSAELPAATRLRELEGIEGRLAALERELQQTRTTLRDERARRDRAISLIKPASPAVERQPQPQAAS